MKASAKDISQIGMFVAAIAVSAQFAILLPGGVPITLQVWAILLAAILLGAKKGAWAAFVYVLIGTAGMPVFAAATGGPGVVIGPTGGFILSFPIMAFIVGLGAQKGGIIRLALVLTGALTLNFLCGMLFFAAVTQSALQTALMVAVAPFLPVAAVQIVVMTAFGASMRAALSKIRGGE